MLLVINFKNYVSGKKALKLSKIIEKYIPDAIICPDTADISIISKNTKAKVFSQHADSLEGKRNTGFQILESLKNAGTKGTLLNHSEHKISFSELSKTIKLCRKLKIREIVCASSVREAERIKKLKPWAVAFEDPKLISTGKSVTKYNPESIKKFVRAIKGTKVIPLCGAGINSKEDISAASKFGCKGVLIASAIANSKNPEKILKSLKK